MARLFNGNTDHIDFGNSALLLTPVQSFSIWIKPSSLPHAYNAVYSYRSSSLRQLFVNAFGKIAIYLGATGTVFYDGTGITTLSPGVWYQIGFSYNSVNGLIGIVNGVVDGTAAANGPLNVAGGSTQVIGWDNSDTTARAYAGGAAYAGMWSRALDISEWEMLAAGVPPSSLGATWSAPLDGLSSPEPDLSGNFNQGVLTGTSWAEDPLLDYFSEDDDRIVFQGGAPSTPGFFSRYYYDMPAGARLAA